MRKHLSSQSRVCEWCAQHNTDRTTDSLDTRGWWLLCPTCEHAMKEEWILDFRSSAGQFQINVSVANLLYKAIIICQILSCSLLPLNGQTSVNAALNKCPSEAMTMWQWTNMHNSRILKLKQLNEISHVIIFTFSCCGTSKCLLWSV